MERKAAEDLSIDFQAQSPAHVPVRGFCFFMHAIRPQTPCPRPHFAAIEFPETDSNSILRE